MPYIICHTTQCEHHFNGSCDADKPVLFKGNNDNIYHVCQHMLDNQETLFPTTEEG